jgi:hypothetical protein
LMVYVPLFMALTAGLKSTAAAKEYLKFYVEELNSANNDLAYKNGLESVGVQLAEALFRYRESGRNKFSVIFSNSLKFTAKELLQLLNEGANKKIAGGTNNNILVGYSLTDDRAIYETVFAEASQSQTLVFLLNKNEANYKETLEYIEGLKNKGIPCIVISIDLTDDLKNNLKVLARTSALLQDTVVYFTYITNQDANSNPSVKLVRELTAAGFDKVKEKKAQGQDILMSFADVISKIEAEQALAEAAISEAFKVKNIQKPAYSQEFDVLNQALEALAQGLGIFNEDFSRSGQGGCGRSRRQ